MGELILWLLVPMATYFIGYTSGKQLTKTKIRNALSAATVQLTSEVHKAINDA